MMNSRRQGREKASGFTNTRIKRAARRAGCVRISGDVYDKARDKLDGFLKTIVEDTITMIRLKGLRTITPDEVVHALALRGVNLYGFDNSRV